MCRRNRAKFVEDLVHGATGEAILSSCPPESAYRAVRNGQLQEVPERCKPGRSIMRLSSEDRALVKTLKSKDFNHGVS